MTATDAVPSASSCFCSPGALDPRPDFRAEPMKIEVSCLSAFSSTPDSTSFKPPGILKPYNETSPGAVKVEIPGCDQEAPHIVAHLLEDHQKLLAEQQLLAECLSQHHAQEQFGGQPMFQDPGLGANTWLQSDAWWAYEPPSVWPEVCWPQVCWPEVCSETWQEYPSPLAWQDAILPDEAKLLETPKRKAAKTVDSIETGIEGISGESTEEGYAMSGCTSEEDCFSPKCSENRKEHIDVTSVAQNGAEAGQALLALLKGPEMEDHYSEGDHLSLDDLLLVMMEERESKESGADEKNSETFGADAVVDWSIVDMSQPSNVNSDDLTRVLPPAPKELPPTPPIASIPDECTLVFPPGLPCSASPLSACGPIELPPGLDLPSCLESNSGSDADESDTEPLRSFSTSNNQACWSSWLVNPSYELPKHTCSDNDTACLSFRLEDAQKSSDEELIATRSCARETSLPQIKMAKSNVPKSCKHGSEVSTNVALGRASGKKAQKTRSKTLAEPRRPRNKNPEVASGKLEHPAASTALRTTKDVDSIVDNTPGRSSWIRFVVLGFLFVGIVLLAMYQKQLFGANGLQNGTSNVLLQGESHAWGTQSPIDAPAHARNQQISSFVRNMDIEFARAKAVASDIKSKLNKRNGARELRKIKKQQEQIMQRQHDNGIEEEW